MNDNFHRGAGTGGPDSGSIYAAGSSLFVSLEYFSVGVFGFSFTLLGQNFVLADVSAEGSLAQALLALTPTALVFLIAVFIIAIEWWEHHHLFRLFGGSTAPSSP